MTIAPFDEARAKELVTTLRAQHPCDANVPSLAYRLADQLEAAVREIKALGPVFEAAKAVLLHRKTADIAHVVEGWLKTALDLDKALEAAVEAALAVETKR